MSEHALLSASSAHRWLRCPPSAVAATMYPERETEYTKEGTWAHKAAELVVGYRRGTQAEDPRELFTPEMYRYAEEYADYIDEHTPADAFVLTEHRVSYERWVPGGFGTCDCIIIADGTLTVIDYKYGEGVAVSATENEQMRLYALGAYDELGYAFDISEVDLHIFQPRMSSISSERLTVPELLSWAEESVVHAAAQAAKGEGEYTPGEHCRWCPHGGRCRALTAACTEIVQTHGISAEVPILSPQEIADVLAQKSLVTLWLKRIEGQAYDTLMAGGEIPGYKLVEGRLGNRKWSDELQVAAALEQAGYSREDYTETRLLSPSGLDTAIGKKQVKELLSELIERSPGAPTVVPTSDKRPAYDRLAEAQKDFN